MQRTANLNVSCPSSRAWTLGLVVGLVCGSAAQAGRPLQTDDAGVLDRGACEMEAFAARVSIAATRKRQVQMGCGLGLSTQLALATGSQRAEGERTQTVSLAGKTELLQGPAAAAGPGSGTETGRRGATAAETRSTSRRGALGTGGRSTGSGHRATASLSEIELIGSSTGAPALSSSSAARSPSVSTASALATGAVPAVVAGIAG